MPSAVPEDTKQEILPPSLPRNQPFPSQNRYLTHLSLVQPPPPILHQPSLPLMRGSGWLSLPSRQTLDPDITVSLLQPAPVLTSQQMIKSPFSPNFERNAPIPVATENADSGLERQKLNALVIASGLADKDELWTNGPANNPSASRVYPEPKWSVPIEVKSSQGENTRQYVAPIVSQKQFVINPCPSGTSTHLQEEFDELEDNVKEANSPFSPYCHPSKNLYPVSKWSLSSSVEMDLANKRSSPSKSLKTKAVKFWSFLSRFSSNSQSSSNDKHALSSAVDVQPEKSIFHQRSHSDLVESVAGCSSVSLQTPAFTNGLWNCVPPTPTTALSISRISSSSYSLATPNNHKVNSDDQVSPGRRCTEKLATRKSVSSIGSPVPLTGDPSSSLTWSGKDTSIENSAVDTPAPPLKHMISGFKGLVFRIGLADADDSQEKGSGRGKESPKEAEKPPTSVPCTFRKGTMLKDNSPAPSLILGKNGNNAAKTTKPKRKLLIHGFEQGNHRKIEATISS